MSSHQGFRSIGASRGWKVFRRVRAVSFCGWRNWLLKEIFPAQSTTWTPSAICSRKKWWCPGTTKRQVQLTFQTFPSRCQTLIIPHQHHGCVSWWVNFLIEAWSVAQGAWHLTFFWAGGVAVRRGNASFEQPKFKKKQVVGTYNMWGCVSWRFLRRNLNIPILLHGSLVQLTKFHEAFYLQRKPSSNVTLIWLSHARWQKNTVS